MRRFLAIALIVIGSLLIVEVAITLLWQEPFTSLIANQGQSDLAKRPLSQTAGDPIGHIELPSLGRSYMVIQGTDEGSLEKGPGHFPQTAFPGQGGTIGVAGHRTTYLAPFRTINDLKPGDPIVMAMPNGRFTYSVEYTQIVDPNATWVTNPVGYERLVLSACNPIYSASQRIIVFARLR